MKPQTKNFIDLCKGNNPASIRTSLGFQSNTVLNDLYEIYSTKDHGEISLRLSGGF